MVSVRPQLTTVNTRKGKLAELHELAAIAGSYIGLTGRRCERYKINRTWETRHV
jgi:hypothetical protein